MGSVCGSVWQMRVDTWAEAKEPETRGSPRLLAGLGTVGERPDMPAATFL